MADYDEQSEGRVVITARISPESAAGWRRFCDASGVSMTAMLEAAGRDLAEETFPPTAKERQRMVLNAREIDRQRRVRKRSRSGKSDR